MITINYKSKYKYGIKCDWHAIDLGTDAEPKLGWELAKVLGAGGPWKSSPKVAEPSSLWKEWSRWIQVQTTICQKFQLREKSRKQTGVDWSWRLETIHNKRIKWCKWKW